MPERDATVDQERLAALTLPVLLAETGAWISALNKGVELSQTEAKLLIAVGVATGGFLGFLVGDRDKGSVDSPAFQQKLATDKGLWVSFDKFFRTSCRTLRQEKLLEDTDSLLAEMQSEDHLGSKQANHAEKDERNRHLANHAELKIFTERLLRDHPEMKVCYAPQ